MLYCSSSGTLKSTRIKAFLPEKSKLSMVFICIFFVYPAHKAIIRIGKFTGTSLFLMNFHGKGKTGLYAPQLKASFHLRIIAVIFAQFPLAEPGADPIGRSPKKRF